MSDPVTRRIGDDPRADDELVVAARLGDRDALEVLLGRHHARLLVICRRVTGNAADAADACQEALIAIARGIGRFDGRAAFSTWSYRVAVNASLDELRRRRRRPALLRGDHDGGTDSSDGGHHAPFDPVDIHAELDLAALIDRLGDGPTLEVGLAGLPEEFRLPVVLRDVADLDYAEIAAALGIPLGTVKSRIARGRAALAHALLAAPGNRPRPPERRTDTP